MLEFLFTQEQRGLSMGLICININLSNIAVTVSIGGKCCKGPNRSLAKVIFWRVLLPIIISRDDEVFEGKYFNNINPYMLC